MPKTQKMPATSDRGPILIVLGVFVVLFVGFVCFGGGFKCFISLFVFRKHIHAEGGFLGGDDKR